MEVHLLTLNKGVMDPQAFMSRNNTLLNGKRTLVLNLKATGRKGPDWKSLEQEQSGIFRSPRGEPPPKGSSMLLALVGND